VFDWVRQPNSIEHNPMDCVNCSVNKFAWTKIMLYGLENTKSRCYTEVTPASKDLLLIFHASCTKNQEFENQKFDLVPLSNYFCVSLIWFNCSIYFDWVRLKYSSIAWVRLTMPGKNHAKSIYSEQHDFNGSVADDSRVNRLSFVSFDSKKAYILQELRYYFGNS